VTLELPNDKDNPLSRNFWYEQVKDLKLKLEKLTGKKVHRDNLKNAISLLYNRTSLSRELFELRRSSHHNFRQGLP